MTTPVPEPYGVAMKGNGTDRDLVPYYNKLPEGVNLVTVSTNSPVGLTIRSFPAASFNNATNLGVIPASTANGTRSVSFQVPVAAGESRYIHVQVNSQPVADSTIRAAITVVTLPLKTAGGG